VATDWAPVIQTGIGAVAGIGGGVIGAWLQSRSQERIEQRRLQHEERADRQQRRDRAAEALAEVSGVMRGMHVQHTILDMYAQTSPEAVPERTHADLEQLRLRQQAASEHLLLVAMREPSPKVRQLAQDLEKTMSSACTATWMSLASRTMDNHSEPIAELASQGQESYYKARDLLDKLVEEL
jgi:hypothetical protein